VFDICSRRSPNWLWEEDDFDDVRLMLLSQEHCMPCAIYTASRIFGNHICLTIKSLVLVSCTAWFNKKLLEHNLVCSEYERFDETCFESRGVEFEGTELPLLFPQQAVTLDVQRMT